MADRMTVPGVYTPEQVKPRKPCLCPLCRQPVPRQETEAEVRARFEMESG